MRTDTSSGTGSVWRSAPFIGAHAPRFLLLFGTPRSGTTWLGKIFDSHPLTLYKHEPDRSGFDLPFAPSVEVAERWRRQIQDFVERLAQNSTAHAAARLPVFRKKYRPAIAQPLHRLSVLTAGAASSFRWRVPVLQWADVRKPDVRVVWKSTDSLGRLGVILHALDDYRAVRIIRHPCGYIASVMRGEAQHKFVSSVRTSEDYGMLQSLLRSSGRGGRGLTIEHLRQLHPVERMAWIWVLLNEKAEGDTQNNPRCTSIRYEDVCRDPLTRVKELFTFCGLDWDSQTEEFIRASTGGSPGGGFNRFKHDSHRYYSVFRNPLQAADKWKSEMKLEDIDRIYRVMQQSDLIRLYPQSETAPVRNSA